MYAFGAIIVGSNLVSFENVGSGGKGKGLLKSCKKGLFDGGGKGQNMMRESVSPKSGAR